MTSLFQHTLAKRFLTFLFTLSGISINTKPPPPPPITVNLLPTIHDGIALHSRLPKKKTEYHVPP